MPQSLSRVLIHLVFSTKNRAPSLLPSVQTELHAYLAGVLKGWIDPAFFRHAVPF
jgi:putative transposase